MRIRLTAAAALMAATGLLAAACSSASNSADTAGSTPSACSSARTDAHQSGPAAEVPPQIRKTGVLVFGNNLGYPPWDEVSSGKPAGADVELGDAIARQLDLCPKWSQLSFGTLITSLQDGRINLILSAMSDTKAREKVINFVDYYNTPWGLLVPYGNPRHLTGLASLCGTDAAAESGTVGVTFLQQQDSKCHSLGRPPIQITTFDTDPDIQLAIRSGRVDCDLENYDALSYDARTLGGGKVFTALPLATLPSSPYGIGVAMSDPRLLTAVQAALSKVIASGTYRRALSSYGLPAAGFVPAARINHATF